MSRDFGHSPLNFSMMSPVIKALIVANLFVFALSMLVGGEFVSLFGLVPSKVIAERWVWQPFTYLFLHANLFHILFNLFALWMFGMPVEAQWGPRRFLQYYLICGVGAGLVNVALTPGSSAPIIGASGAIYGLLVAFAMLFPESIVYLYFFFPIKAKHMALLFGVVEFLAGASAANPGVARFAHLTGMVIGFVYIRWWDEAVFRLSSWRPSFGSPKRRSREKASVAFRVEPGIFDEAVEVDRILDKILEKGESSLTESERELLRRQARRPPEGRA